MDQIPLHHRERVQLEQCGDLVHHPFDRKVELGPTATPHGTGWAFIGEDDLIEVLSYCFPGIEIKLLSVIREKTLLVNFEKSVNLALPVLQQCELILLASVEHWNLLDELLTQHGYQKNKDWVLFS